MRSWIKDLLFVACWVAAVASLAWVYSPARGQACRGHSYQAPYAAPVIVKERPYAAPVVVKEAPYVVTKEKVVEVVVPRFVAVIPLVDLPSYSAAYVGPGIAVGQPPQQQQAGELRQILDEVRSLGARIRRLEDRGDRPEAKPQPKAEPKAEPKEESKAKPKPADPFEGEAQTALPDVRAINKAKCAMCHERGKQAAGGDFVLSEPDGSIVKLTDLQLLDLMIHCEKKTMPKLTQKSRAAGVKPLTDPEIASWLAEAARQRAINKK